ncbi:hypothetical protein CASFOL_031120 [Castilleja foliolosa]|uniref:F-box domain-containing protein n=1 Tax=Castilleja foliolosa TaxID=1961234 RepID=A0ABD3C6Q2_9LAMI
MVKLTDSHLNTEEEEGNSMIDVPKKRVKVKNCTSHSYYLRSLKTNINSLPDEIVFDILVQIPAQDIYSAVRPVCLKWYQMIHTHTFVNTHLHRSTYGLLIQNRSSPPFTLTFMALSRQGRVELTRVAILTAGLLIFDPFTPEGFVHWVSKGNHVVTLNVETEIITEYLVPSSCSGDRFGGRYYYLPTVKCLSLLIYCRRWWSWEVWEMKPETGEWTNLPGIELNDRKCEILEWYSKRDLKSVGYSDGWLEPFGWLKYGEVLICCFTLPHEVKKHQVCIAYNVRSKEIEYIELDCNRKRLLVHRNSLLWLDGY